MLRAIAAILCAVLLQSPVEALELGRGTLPIAYEPARSVALAEGEAFIIEGTVEAAGSVGVVLRVDDVASDSYANRVNDERTLAPGPFKLVVPVQGLRTPGGRTLDHTRLTRVILFVPGGGGGVSITRFATTLEPQGPAAATSAAAPTPLDRLKPATLTLPVALEPSAPAVFGDHDEIIIEGRVEGPAGAVLVVRVDDTYSTGYASRVNLERQLPAGPFRIALQPADLRTENGRALDHRAVTRIIVFALERGTAIKLGRFEVTRPVERERSTGPAAERPRQLGRGTLPIRVETARGERFEDDDQLVITGIAETAETVGLLIRVDDGQSHDYGSRFNDERTLSAGPFSLKLGLKGLKTSGSRVINHRDVRRIIVAMFQGRGTIKVDTFAVERAIGLPVGVSAYSLGGLDAPVPWGMERIGPGDNRVKGAPGGQVRVIRRPMPDPVVANGLMGIAQLRLAQPPGRARVTLFTEDPGEWELLPAPLQRRIRVNGQVALDVRLDPREWIAQRYLRNATAEHGRDDDAWSAYGRWRGNPVALDVDVGQDGVVIDLAGVEPSALYLSAVIIEPAASTKGIDHVQALRADWYRSTFPIGKEPVTVSDPALPVQLQASAAGEQPLAPARVSAAPGTGARLRLALTSPTLIERPSLTLEPPALDAKVDGATPEQHQIQTRMWAGQWRLGRADLNQLRLGDARLVADLASLPLAPATPRHYELWFTVPETASAGLYRGALVLSAASGVVSETRLPQDSETRLPQDSETRLPHDVRLPIEVEVLAHKLPPVAKAAGFYHDEAAYLTWSPALRGERDRQVRCDLDLLAAFGSTGTSPAMAPVANPDPSAFLADTITAARAGVQPGWLVYQNLQGDPDVERTADRVVAAARAVAGAGVPPLVWSVADEPSNVDLDQSSFPALVKALRRRAPGIRLGGHFNSPADEKFVDLVDTVLINYGFGLDQANIARLAARGRDVWLYNTVHVRLSAGLWLWRSKATRYVQWHARMPTADPFDPLDGREGDHQMIYPGRDVCSAQPDINRELLRMAEGIVDQRWLLWLETRREPEAVRLARELHSIGGDKWKPAGTLSEAELARMRDRIVELARRLD